MTYIQCMFELRGKCKFFPMDYTKLTMEKIPRNPLESIENY